MAPEPQRHRDRFFRIYDSSAVVRFVRRVVAGSILCGALVPLARWLLRVERRATVGLRGEWSSEQALETTDKIGALAANSRVVSALWSLVMAPSAALQESRVRRLIEPLVALDIKERVRLVGCVVVVAMLTHVVFLQWLGVSVEGLGWSARTGLVAAGAIIWWRPAPLAAAWTNRTARRAERPRA